jgi:hypothetical protein
MCIPVPLEVAPTYPSDPRLDTPAMAGAPALMTPRGVHLWPTILFRPDKPSLEIHGVRLLQ